MIVKVWLSENSQPIHFLRVKNAYYKGRCALHLMFENGDVTAFPLCNIFMWQATGEMERARTVNQTPEGEVP